jgi:hypothetical protein
MENKLKFKDVARYLWNWRDWEIEEEDMFGGGVVQHKYSKMFYNIEFDCINLRNRISRANTEIIFSCVDSGIFATIVITFLANRIKSKLKTNTQ